MTSPSFAPDTTTGSTPRRRGLVGVASAVALIASGAVVLSSETTSAAAPAPSPATPAPGSAATPAPESAVNDTVCNQYCDGRDPALAAGDRIPVTADLSGRTVQLHLSDGDPMGWASLENTLPGDELWLDRSFDGGATWDSGSRLGATTAPEGVSAWRTLMYNNDDWANRGVGALRACARAVDTGAVACTEWARTHWNASNRAEAAATAMMALYDTAGGLFPEAGWWGSAVALSGVIGNIDATHMASYEYAVSTTYDRNVGERRGHFRNEFSDDTGWWAMAWIDAYDLTGQRRYLETARLAADHMHTFWTPACGGGIRWKEGETYKAAISNALYVQVNAAIANRTGDTGYADRASAGWSWIEGSGLIGADGLVLDGVGADCSAGGTIHTYNQGVLMSGLVELSRATGAAGLVQRARELADDATRPGSFLTDGAGILHDPAEGWDTCTDDGAYFKAAFARGLDELDDAVDGSPYADYLTRQADSAHATSRNAFDQYSLSWSEWTQPQGPGCQASALALVNAAD